MMRISENDILSFVYDKQEASYNELIKEFVKSHKCSKPSLLNLKKGLEKAGKLKKRISEKTGRAVYFVPPEFQQETRALTTRRTVEKKAAQTYEKGKQTRIKIAEMGGYPFPVPFGWTKIIRLVNGVRAHIPVETNDVTRVKELIRDFLTGESLAAASRKHGIDPCTAGMLLKNTFLKGEFELDGKIYRASDKGLWKGLLTPEEFDELQGRSPPEGSIQLLRFGYMWKDGRKMLRPGAKEVYQQVFQLRKERKTTREIAETVIVPEGLRDCRGVDEKGRVSRFLVETILQNSRELTGKTEVDGKPVDSGLEPAVDDALWQEVENMEFPNAVEIYKKMGTDFKKEIMRLVPAFRWELREKTASGKNSLRVSVHVNRLKKSGMLKERDDGLLQRSWEPFPTADTWPKTLNGRQSKARIKVLQALPEEETVTTTQLSQKANISAPAAKYHLLSFEKRGILIRVKYGEYRLSEIGRKIKEEIGSKDIANQKAE